MCTARPQWMSISQQKINYKSKSYRVEVCSRVLAPISHIASNFNFFK